MSNFYISVYTIFNFGQVVLFRQIIGSQPTFTLVIAKMDEMVTGFILLQMIKKHFRLHIELLSSKEYS